MTLPKWVEEQDSKCDGCDCGHGDRMLQALAIAVEALKEIANYSTMRHEAEKRISVMAKFAESALSQIEKLGEQK